jgi:hypothetical protein
VHAEVIEIVSRRGAQWVGGASVRMVELWAGMRAAGYREELGFKPEALRLYVDTVRWLAREELRIFARGVTGAVSTEDSARMAEAGIELVNQMLAILRREVLLRYIAEGNVPVGDGEAAEPARG